MERVERGECKVWEGVDVRGMSEGGREGKY